MFYFNPVLLSACITYVSWVDFNGIPLHRASQICHRLPQLMVPEFGGLPLFVGNQRSIHSKQISYANYEVYCAEARANHPKLMLCPCAHGLDMVLNGQLSNQMQLIHNWVPLQNSISLESHCGFICIQTQKHCQ